MPIPGRVVSLVLVSPAGAVLGRLPPTPVAVPWWQDATAVVAMARERADLDVAVLRLLEAELPEPPGGHVTYLAETADETGAAAVREPSAATLDEQPLRMPWARPGGPAADLAWADDRLVELGTPRTGAAEQIRTWNLSSLWRLPIPGGKAWLKHVPPFFAHEGPLIRHLERPWTPTLLATDGGRSLLAGIPGDDHHDAGLEILAPAVERLVELQREQAAHVDDLLALGLPDWRAAALTRAIADTIERTADELDAADRATLGRFIEELPARWARVADAGLPETLVHGDFAGGNLRGDPALPTLLDWGDAGVGHPLLDQPAMLDRAPAPAVEPLREHWVAAWRAAVPDSDPAAAARHLGPIAAARQAVIYRTFLDRIEPAEHPYHRRDPAAWLRIAAERVREEAAG